jgi:hypothetical protein
LIYICSFAITTGLIWLVEHSKENKYNRIVVIIALLIPCLLAAFRASSIGTDYEVYLKPIFLNALKSNSFIEYLNSRWYSIWRYIYVKDWEIGFTTIIYIVSKLTHSLQFCAFVVEAFIIFPTYGAIENCSHDKNKAFSVFIYLFTFFNISLNNMRQFIAIGFLLLAFSYMLSSNYNIKRAIIYCVISILFHSTAIIGVVFYGAYVFIVKNVKKRKLEYNKNNYKKIVRMIFVGICVIFAVYSVLKIPMIKSLFYNYGWYLSGNFSFMPNQIILRLPILLLYLICWKKQSTDEKYLYGILLIIEIVFSQLAGMSSQTIRITYYCSSFYVISIPYFLKWKNTTTLHSVFSLAIHVYFVIYWLYMYVISNVGATYPYIFYK